MRLLALMRVRCHACCRRRCLRPRCRHMPLFSARFREMLMVALYAITPLLRCHARFDAAAFCRVTTLCCRCCHGTCLLMPYATRHERAADTRHAIMPDCCLSPAAALFMPLPAARELFRNGAILQRYDAPCAACAKRHKMIQEGSMQRVMRQRVKSGRRPARRDAMLRHAPVRLLFDTMPLTS